eukprot:TRINITY_DN56472_c0_g1_i1.p1 TRINITY_DN56472_c0_g1~~TRINITY_DN56472_c0_g1_i1.p1  ORF type:complete len:377 (+),score=41.18 TRINITY_DN56472_c0_g1_i1:14-1144(+)
MEDRLRLSKTMTRVVQMSIFLVLNLDQPNAFITASMCPDGFVPWPRTLTITSTTESRQETGSASSNAYTCENSSVADNAAVQFLWHNLPPMDALNTGSLFDGGIVTSTVQLALAARVKNPWAAAVPRDVWQNWVLPYASVNEARSNWRQMMWDDLQPLVNNDSFVASSLTSAAEIVNRAVWSKLRPNQTAIKFKPQQTPLIYDPMSTVAFGYASCTGISLLLVDALRAIGVPARLVGTPAWNGSDAGGNHNWVEVWLGRSGTKTSAETEDETDEWAIIEGQPAGPGESFANPCDKWFCNAAHFSNGKTKVYATTFDRSDGTIVYPMAWDLKNRAIPGIDRSEYYTATCTRCGGLLEDASAFVGRTRSDVQFEIVQI